MGAAATADGQPGWAPRAETAPAAPVNARKLRRFTRCNFFVTGAPPRCSCRALGAHSDPTWTTPTVFVIVARSTAPHGMSTRQASWDCDTSGAIATLKHTIPLAGRRQMAAL